MGTSRFGLTHTVAFVLLWIGTAAPAQLVSGPVALVSQSNAGVPGNGESDVPAMSANGRFVLFQSGSTNLIDGPPVEYRNTFLKDLVTGSVTGYVRIAKPRISQDGRYVAFASVLPLIPQDTNVRGDTYRLDRFTGVVARVSVAQDGKQPDMDCIPLAISASGRFVLFNSLAFNLGQVRSREGDLFLKDMDTGSLTHVSVSSLGEVSQDNYDATSESISADGRYVVFHTNDVNFPRFRDGGWGYGFRKDLLTGALDPISENSKGVIDIGDAASPSISGDGRYVAFQGPSWGPGFRQVYRKDMKARTFQLVSADLAGTAGDAPSYMPTITSDGRYIAFYSEAGNLVSDGMSGQSQIYRKDSYTGAVVCASVSATGTAAESGAKISADGRYVAFLSSSKNLGPSNDSGQLQVYRKDLGALGISGVHTVSRVLGGNPSGNVFSVRTPDDVYFSVSTVSSPSRAVIRFAFRVLQPNRALSMAMMVQAKGQLGASFDASILSRATGKYVSLGRRILLPGDVNHWYAVPGRPQEYLDAGGYASVQMEAKGKAAFVLHTDYARLDVTKI